MSLKSALYQISDPDYLKSSWRAINKRNLRSKGLDDVTIQNFKAGLERNLQQISVEIRARTYEFQKLRPHAMEKLGSKEKRPLRIAAVRDRVVMKALEQFIGPAFQVFNLPCSFAYVKNGGVEAAVKRIKDLVAQGSKVYLKSDIIKFFDSVDKEVLWRKFARHIRYRSLLPLLRGCFNLEIGDIELLKTEDQELFLGCESGIPQGGCLSPLLANFYLFEFDCELTNKNFNLVRYADDFVVMCESHERALQAHELCERSLTALGLKIHPLGSGKTRIDDFSKAGLDFLGLRFEGKDVFPAEKSKQRFIYKVEETLKPHSGISLPRTLQKLSNLIHGWGKHYRGMRVGEIYPALDKFIQHAVRSYLRKSNVVLMNKKQWAAQRKFLGIPSMTAMIEHVNAVSQPTVKAAAASQGSASVATVPSSVGAA